jgi:hypothetical protein
VNILFATQSGSLQLFYLFERFLAARFDRGKTGYYVSNRRNYQRFVSRKSEGWPGNRIVLAEWEILDEALRGDARVSRDDLDRAESMLSDSTLWNAAVCDRRIFYGPKSVFTQDYPSRYSHEQMQAVIAVALRRIEEQIDSLRPDLVLSFMCVTFGEYLCFLIARKKGIPYLNIKDTKIDEFFVASADIQRPEREIRERFRKTPWTDYPDSLRAEVEKYLERYGRGRVTYDGQDYVHAPERTRPFSWKGLARVPRAFLNRQKIVRGHPEQLRDNQPDPFEYSLYNDLIKPFRYHRIRKRHDDRFIRPDRLGDVPFAFYPLHLEPEMSVLVWGRPYLNQVELIRTIAMSLPFSWKLVVKEHPKNPFYRKSGYYRKLAEIPNVLFVDHDVSTRELILASRLVVTLCGFVGFEALCLGRPAVSLAGCVYEFLPRHMFRKVAEPARLGAEIRDLLSNFREDREALKRFAAAVMHEGVRFPWYSLGKKVRNYFDAPLDEFPDKSKEIETFERFARYVEERMDRCYPASSPEPPENENAALHEGAAGFIKET